MLNLNRRRANPSDTEFLLQLRRSLMDPHLIASGADTSLEAHLERLHYRFDCAEILLAGNRPVGLLKIARDEGNWELIQLQLIPELQGRGIGTQLLRQLIVDATAAGVSLTLSVLKANPARALYERLGFVAEGESAVEYHLRWHNPPG